MRELRFDGLSPDGTQLVLAGKDGQRYAVIIDEKLEAAVRRDRSRIGQIEIEQAGVLRPREIQARIRAGATAEDVAAASGLSLEHVRRFEGPVLTERAWVAQQAQATQVRRPGGDIELGELVSEHLTLLGVDRDGISWDAWRRDDGQWVVIATFRLDPHVHIATWTYDGSTRTMTVVDQNARELSAMTQEQPPRLVASRTPLTAVAGLGGQTDEDEGDWDGEGEALAESEIADTEHELNDSPDGEQEWLPLGSHDEDVPEDDAPAPAGDAASDRAPETAGSDASDEDADAGDESLFADDEDEEEPPAHEEAPAATSPLDALFGPPSGPATHRSSGKPAVPSFDDILFGPGHSR